MWKQICLHIRADVFQTVHGIEIIEFSWLSLASFEIGQTISRDNSLAGADIYIYNLQKMIPLCQEIKKTNIWSSTAL